MTAEQLRIDAMAGDPETWRLWGPYLAERAWGTVREDTSTDGACWDSFTHDDARRRAYRWSEDGLGGLCDIRQRICFAPALWNGADPILKERLFGLTGPEGNHGEDVKEVYFYADATPSHSYLKFVYHYPQRAFPYADLVAESRRRDRSAWEYELWDTGTFADGRYFVLTVEYAKAAADDIVIRITADNRGPDSAPLWILPQLWFRNVWSHDGAVDRPRAFRVEGGIETAHPGLPPYRLMCADADAWLFTENETGPKDAFHRRIVHGDPGAASAADGTKCAAVLRRDVPAGGTVSCRLRLTRVGAATPEADERVLARAVAEADAYYAALAPPGADPEAQRIQREALAGMIWSKQFYHLDTSRWIDERPAAEPSRNAAWKTLHAADVISMPDTWEYPWFAAWDLAFHMIPFTLIDADFAKHQLLLLCREWYQHPSGQLPAYEWAFSDVNPPVHAWAALRVYKIEKRLQGKGRHEAGDTDFLERIFHKLLLNFTWWVNRKDAEDNNIFEGGFLGLDNIGVFDRSAPLPGGGLLEQCDGTAWMAMYCLNLLAIALELSRTDRAYEDVATKFAEHFCYIAHALNGMGMWDQDDGFYYDILHLPDGRHLPLKVRSIVGLIPVFAVEVFDAQVLAGAPGFTRRLQWFLENKPEIAREAAQLGAVGQEGRAIFSLVGPDRLRRILSRVLDPAEFLSPYGVRSLSRHHADQPYVFPLDPRLRVDYAPAESTTALFGGNSNWRGPIWFPINYLLIESLQKFDFAYGTSFLIDGKDLWAVAGDLSARLVALFRRAPDGKRPCFGGIEHLQGQEHLLFHEHFHADNGAGLGASHQTGWTGLVAKLIAQNVGASGPKS